MNTLIHFRDQVLRVRPDTESKVKDMMRIHKVPGLEMVSDRMLPKLRYLKQFVSLAQIVKREHESLSTEKLERNRKNINE